MKIQIMLVGILLSPSLTWGVPAELKASGGKVEFLAIGKPAFIKIRGSGSSPSGQVQVDGDKVTGQFDFEVASLDTGIDMRNEHMKNRYLEVGKFPKATLVLKSTSKINGWSKENPKVSDASFDGILTLHGVSQPVSGKFNVAADGHTSVVFKVKMSDFKVEVPTFAGVTVADDVEVNVSIDKLQ